MAGQYLRMYSEHGSSKSSSHSPGSWVCTSRMTLGDSRDRPAMVLPQNWKREHGGRSGSDQAGPTPAGSFKLLASAHLDAVNVWLDVAPRFQVQHVH